jgi:hypothetical protein
MDWNSEKVPATGSAWQPRGTASLGVASII